MYCLSSETIRKHLASDELFLAILETSATLEELFFSQLIHEIGIYPKLIENWTLGKLLKWASELNLIVGNEKYYPIFKDFIQLRNIAVHSGGFIIQNLSEEKKKGIRQHLGKICIYIASAPVRDEAEDMREIADSHLQKGVEKRLNFLDKYRNNTP